MKKLTKKTEKLELLLMDYRSEKQSVMIEENAQVKIIVLSGDHVLREPMEYDPSDSRLVNFYDGEIEFQATKENVAKYNAMENTYDYEEITFS